MFYLQNVKNVFQIFLFLTFQTTEFLFVIYIASTLLLNRDKVWISLFTKNSLHVNHDNSSS